MHVCVGLCVCVCVHVCVCAFSCVFNHISASKTTDHEFKMALDAGAKVDLLDSDNLSPLIYAGQFIILLHMVLIKKILKGRVSLICAPKSLNL